jgi:hypothetical protein
MVVHGEFKSILTLIRIFELISLYFPFSVPSIFYLLIDLSYLSFWDNRMDINMQGPPRNIATRWFGLNQLEHKNPTP